MLEVNDGKMMYNEKEQVLRFVCRYGDMFYVIICVHCMNACTLGNDSQHSSALHGQTIRGLFFLLNLGVLIGVRLSSSVHCISAVFFIVVIIIASLPLCLCPFAALLPFWSLLSNDLLLFSGKVMCMVCWNATTIQHLPSQANDNDGNVEKRFDRTKGT